MPTYGVGVSAPPSGWYKTVVASDATTAQTTVTQSLPSVTPVRVVVRQVAG